MAVWAYADLERSPIADALAPLSSAERCRLLYETLLPLTPSLLTEPERYRDLWSVEDAHLEVSERTIGRGDITVAEHREVDLAAVTVPPQLPAHPGHRFGAGGAMVDVVHPMAVHNTTDCVRLVVSRGDHVVVDRYESWVQYRGRPLPQRVDMAPLAEKLSAPDAPGVEWSAQAPSSLMPVMRPAGPSSLPQQQVVDLLVGHLADAPPAWDPFALR